MLVDFNFMACGEAGQGVQSIGWVFAKTMSYGGFHVFADQDYENRVRGGHNFFRVRVSDKKILTFAEKLDILIALHEDAVALHKKDYCFLRPCTILPITKNSNIRTKY